MRRPVMFPINYWNMFHRTHDELTRTSNNVEGWHVLLLRYTKHTTHPHWATLSHNEPKWGTMRHNGPQWATMSHNEKKLTCVKQQKRLCNHNTKPTKSLCYVSICLTMKIISNLVKKKLCKEWRQIRLSLKKLHIQWTAYARMQFIGNIKRSRVWYFSTSLWGFLSTCFQSDRSHFGQL